MIEIFKTNVSNLNEAQSLITKLHNRFPAIHANMDIEDCDRVLRVKGEEFCIDTIIQFVQSYDYRCSVLDV